MFLGSFTITDSPQPNFETYTAIVRYGDEILGNSITPMTVSAETPITLLHTYNRVGTYNIIISVYDSNGGQGTNNLFSTTIISPIPTVTITSTQTSVNQGQFWNGQYQHSLSSGKREMKTVQKFNIVIKYIIIIDNSYLFF